MQFLTDREFAIRQGVLPVTEPECRMYHEFCEGNRAHMEGEATPWKAGNAYKQWESLWSRLPAAAPWEIRPHAF